MDVPDAGSSPMQLSVIQYARFILYIEKGPALLLVLNYRSVIRSAYHVPKIKRCQLRQRNNPAHPVSNHEV